MLSSQPIHGAGFTNHLKPKVFISSIQNVWNLRNLRFKILRESGTWFATLLPF